MFSAILLVILSSVQPRIYSKMIEMKQNTSLLISRYFIVLISEMFQYHVVHQLFIIWRVSHQ